MVQCLILALVLVAFILRVFHLDHQSLWRDEVDAIRFSSEPFINLTSTQDIATLLTQPGHNGPLYFIALHYWRLLTGDSAFALRYFSLIAGVIAIVLTYRVAHQFKIGNFASTVATLIVAISPYLIWYSQEAKMYTWLICLVLLSIYAYRSALASRQLWQSIRWWGIFVLVTVLSFYTHILAPLMLPVYVGWGYLQRRQLRGQWLYGVIAILVLMVPYLPLIWWQVPLLLNQFESGHPFYTFSEQISLLLHLYSVGILRTSFRIWPMILMAFLGIVGLIVPNVAPYLRQDHTTHIVTPSINTDSTARHKNLLDAPSNVPVLNTLPDIRFHLGMWLIIPMLLVSLISLRVAVFEDRYLIYLAPAYAMLVAVGINVIRHRLRWLAWALIAGVIGFSLWSGWLQSWQIIKPDFRAAANYIEAHIKASELRSADGISSINVAQFPVKIYIPMVQSFSNPVVMVQMPYLHHTFDYYFGAPYVSVDGLWTNDNRSEESVDVEMRHQVKNISTLWLVVSEEDLWDTRHLTRAWLNQHAQLVDEASFVGVAVYRYKLLAE